ADAALAKLEPANTPGQPLAPAADAAVAPEPGTQAQAAKAKRARFERGDTDSAIASARRLKSDKPVYITPTTYGLAVGREAPPAWQQHLVVHPDGRVETVSASTDVRPPSEVIPQAEKDGRRKILQARIKRGENVGGVKMLNEFRGETWADEAIAAIKKPTWKTDELAQRAHSLSDEITDDAQAPLYYQKPTQGQPFTLFRGAAQGEPGTVLFYSHDPGIASTYALNRAGAETTENGLKWPQGSKTAEVVEVSVTPKRILDLTGTKAVPEKAMAIIRKHAPEWASQLAKKDEASARVPKEASRNKALWSELGAGYDLAILSDFTHGGVDYSFVPLGLTGMAVKRNAITYVSEKSETPNWKRVVPEPVVNQKDVVDDTAVAAKQAARAAEAKKQRDLMERAHRVMIEGHNQSLEEGDVETDSGESEAKPSKKTRAKKPLLTQEEKA
ncbi:MAG: hypothetical protein IMZ57_04135, partial [Acidobacteria bacterium]|nr:hypothetical protein [Acidobacteriota bacterium]